MAPGGTDNIIHDIDGSGVGAGGLGHPHCLDAADEPGVYRRVTAIPRPPTPRHLPLTHTPHVHDRAAVVKPWKNYSREANSLFVFRVLLGLATFAAFLLVAGAAIVLALPSIRSGHFGLPAVLALVAGIPSALLIALMSGIINVFLLDMVVPIMYVRRLSVFDGWIVFREEFLAGRVGTFVVYILFKIVIGICVGMLTLFITCATCCIAALPYIGTVILLPIFVFDRVYPLYFMSQFGREWRFFKRSRVMPVDESGFGDEEPQPES